MSVDDSSHSMATQPSASGVRAAILSVEDQLKKEVHDSHRTDWTVSGDN